MNIVKPTIEVTFWVPEAEQVEEGFYQPSVEESIEKAARTCYKSESKITAGSAEKFVRMVRERGHYAMLEFGWATAKITADRGLTHELVRHRLASFAQESTRYCNYSKGKFQSEITVVEQPGIPSGTPQRMVWLDAMAAAEKSYLQLIELGVSPQEARSVLPIGLKTEITIGANTREWRHIFEMRCAPAAHPIIRGVMLGALRLFSERMPSLYEDLAEKYLHDVQRSETV